MNDRFHDHSDEELEIELALLRAAQEEAAREGLPNAHYAREIRERERVLDERL